MNERQRIIAIRRRRRAIRRRRQIKRTLFCTAAVVAVIAIAASIIALAASMGKAENEDNPDGQQQGSEAAVIVTKPSAREEKKPETLIKSMDWDADEAYMLAKIAMAEAEGEDTEGKALVILTVLNRVWSPKFPGSIEAVISQNNAFSSYSNGRYDRVEPDRDCWAALDLVQVKHWDESRGALYFERTPEPGENTWHSRNLEMLFTHGNHTFYTEKEERDGD